MTATLMKHNRWRTIRASVLGGVLAASATSACASGTSTSGPVALPGATTPATDPQRGGRITYAIESEPNGLDPSKNGWDVSAQLIAHAIYDPLVAYDVDGKPQPYLLESFAPNADATVWTLTVRDKVKFHDGSPLDAEALMRWSSALRTSAITGPGAVLVTDVVKRGPRTVEATMSRPWATFPSLLTNQTGMVIATKQADDPNGSINPVGTGPFRLKEWDIGTKVVLERNNDYWRAGLPYLDQVDFRSVGDRQSRLSMVETGEVDVTHLNDFQSMDRAKGLTESKKIQIERDTRTTEPAFIAFNTESGPLADRRVREALVLATDKQKLATLGGWPADKLITDRIFSPENPLAPPTDVPTADASRARTLIDDYTRDVGPVAVTLTSVSDPVSLAVTQAIRADWEAVGATVTVETLEEKALVIRAVIGTYEAISFRYFGAYDPDGNFTFFSGLTKKPSREISLNFTRFADDRIDQAIADSQRTTDPTVRKEAYQRLYQRLTDESVFLWLYRSEWVTLAQRRVRDLRNVKLPDGAAAMSRTGGLHRLTETWIDPLADATPPKR